MEDIYRSQFRLPYSLYELLKASADENRRSVNAELISRLEASFSKQEVVRHTLGLPLNDQSAESSEQKVGPITTGIHKDRLLAEVEDQTSDKERAFIYGVLKLLRDAESGIPPDNQAPQPNTGPRPRKRFPKS